MHRCRYDGGVWRVTVVRDSGFGSDRRSRDRSYRGGSCGADDVRGRANAIRDRQAGRPVVPRASDLASRLRPFVRVDDAGEQKSISGLEGDYCLRLSRPIGPTDRYPCVRNRSGFSGRSDTRYWGLFRRSRQHARRTVQGPFGRALSEVVGSHVLTITVMPDLRRSRRCVAFDESVERLVGNVWRFVIGVLVDNHLATCLRRSDPCLLAGAPIISAINEVGVCRQSS